MVERNPVNLGDLRSALIERCQLDTNDPRAVPAVLNALINEAVAHFDMANPHQWPWSYKDTGWQTLPAATTSVTYALGLLAKIDYILLGDTAGSWEYPLVRLAPP